MSDDHPSSSSGVAAADAAAAAADFDHGDSRAESSRSLQHDDDVFSNRSPHSSTGTPADDYDAQAHAHAHQDGDGDGDTGAHHDDDHHDHDNDDHDRRAYPDKAVAHHHDDGSNAHTIPAQTQPQRPFRPSVDVNRALAVSMSSPPPSLFSSPRSATKRSSGMSQFSPRGRTTPSRFRARKESPALVLLHVTVLPLRWAWADVLDRAGEDDALTPLLRGLREGWRQLQDRIGDNVLERGVLLAHPQDDYDVLEERLLEALELPLLRRARILECGHYVGPANEPEAGGEEDDHRAREGPSKVHWCSTCRHDIRFEALGPGKVFRVKVYASNGLIRAGAWAACWREMERVDVELEPITEGDVIAELERLAVDLDIEGLPERVRSRLSRSYTSQSNRHAPKSPSPGGHHRQQRHGDAPPPKTDDERRRAQNDARMREIYGHTPPSYVSPSPSMRGRSRERPRNVSFGHHPEKDEKGRDEDTAAAESRSQPPSKTTTTTHLPSAASRRPPRRDMKDASLPQLVWEALRVFASDGKGAAVLVLALVAILLALRGPARGGGGHHDYGKGGLAVYGNDAYAFGSDETGLEVLKPRDLARTNQEGDEEGGDAPQDSDGGDGDDPLLEVLSQTLTQAATRLRTQTKVEVQIETHTVTKLAKETVQVVHTVTETTTETAMLQTAAGGGGGGGRSLVANAVKFWGYRHGGDDHDDTTTSNGLPGADDIFGTVHQDPCDACRPRID